MTETISQEYSDEFIPFTNGNGITRSIGNTPLLELDHALFPNINPEITIYGKAEWFNPGGSVKDRPAWEMIKQAILDKHLTHKKTIIDASSGNTGIALAMIGASLGYAVKICIPKNASPERLQLLHAYGATVILTDPLEGTDGAIEKAHDIVEQDPDTYYYVDQYNNDNNWKAHYKHTGVEILNQTQKQITHFVTGLGTSGTFTGVARRLKEELPQTQVISMQPDTPFHGLEGLKHMETAIRPGIYDDQLADETISVSTKDAQLMTLKLARQQGILVGISSGANVVAAGRIAQSIDEGVVVTMLCDRGERYLTDKFWEE